MTDVIVIFHFELFFALLPPNSPKNEKFKKMKKMPGDVIILHKFTKNHNHMMWFLRYGVRQCKVLWLLKPNWKLKQGDK